MAETGFPNLVYRELRASFCFHFPRFHLPPRGHGRDQTLLASPTQDEEARRRVRMKTEWENTGKFRFRFLYFSDHFRIFGKIRKRDENGTVGRGNGTGTVRFGSRPFSEFTGKSGIF